ncbi:MAG: ATP-dependent DNA helicase RecG [Ignavibacteriaceae bacterium]
MKTLDDSIQFIKSVGPKRAESFAKVGIKTARDLLFYFPTRYLDRSTLLTSPKAFMYVENGYEGEITILGKVTSQETRHFGRKEILTVHLRDSDGFFECKWFQGAKFYKDQFIEGETFLISAKPSISKFGNLQFIHPDFDKITAEESQIFYNTGKIIPFYRIPKELKVSNIGDLSLRKIISYALESYTPLITETLPQRVIKTNNLLDLSTAVNELHYPKNSRNLEDARKRFKYEELFYLEILVALRKKQIKNKLSGIKFKINSNLVSEFLKHLPFDLTQSQLKVLSEIKADMLSEHTMNRLLQGDVGSGKTIVALISMLIAVDNGYQAAIMAPTEILTDQHYKNFTNIFERFTRHFNEKCVKVSIIIGGQSKKLREMRTIEIESGEADIVLGTHALFEENINFKNLGLVIIDEQHRFGVVQRAKLLSKGTTPDIIVMSATPIPRTLSMTLYGDLDISTINEMPKNRIPIKTLLRGESKLPDIYTFIVAKAKEGTQSFIVYPLVEESEKLELKAAQTYFNDLTQSYLKNVKVGLIHGRMKWREKEEVMFDFAARKYDVLIATTVVEVGIDVPNANIILINDSHRFGLTQLHQLRGRVGRGEEQAYCILVTKDEIIAASNRIKDNLEYLSPLQIERHKASIRLRSMAKYLDGFKIAEIDFKLRGPGDIFGIKQSGFPELKFSDITTDTEILIAAKKDAFEIVEKDPHFLMPENQIIKKNLISYYSDNLKYAKIG